MTGQTLTLSLRVIKLIEKLKQAPWFLRVGMPLEDDSVKAVESWEQAMRLCLSWDWEDDCLEARNALSVTLARDHRKRFQDWNKIVHAVDDHLTSAMENVARRAIAEHSLPEKFEWVLVNMTCMASVEAEYSDIVSPAFFTKLAHWCLAGHLPCGLTEKRPHVAQAESEQPTTDLMTVVKQMQHEMFDPVTEPPDPTLGGSRKLMVS